MNTESALAGALSVMLSEKVAVEVVSAGFQNRRVLLVVDSKTTAGSLAGSQNNRRVGGGATISMEADVARRTVISKGISTKLAQWWDVFLVMVRFAAKKRGRTSANSKQQRGFPVL